MKEKYIDEDYGYWYEFGMGDITTSDGRFDVTCNENNIHKLISEHNRVQAKLVKIALEFSRVAPTEFTKCWYGDKDD